MAKREDEPDGGEPRVDQSRRRGRDPAAHRDGQLDARQEEYRSHQKPDPAFLGVHAMRPERQNGREQADAGKENPHHMPLT